MIFAHNLLFRNYWAGFFSSCTTKKQKTEWKWDALQIGSMTIPEILLQFGKNSLNTMRQTRSWSATTTTMLTSSHEMTSSCLFTTPGSARQTSWMTSIWFGCIATWASLQVSRIRWGTTCACRWKQCRTQRTSSGWARRFATTQTKTMAAQTIITSESLLFNQSQSSKQSLISMGFWGFGVLGFCEDILKLIDL